MCEESDKKTDEPKIELKKEDKPNITIETNPVKVNKNNIDFSEIEPTMNKESIISIKNSKIQISYNMCIRTC